MIYWKKNDSTYEGELKSGEITGLGSKEFPDGRLELGQYNKDKFDGCGVTQSSQKTVEYGVYTQGVKNQLFIKSNEIGDSFMIEYKNDKIDGLVLILEKDQQENVIRYKDSKILEYIQL